MRTVTLGVRSLDETLETFPRVRKAGKGEAGARINFATPELLWKVLTAKRWEILKATRGQGPLSIREIARRVNRDVKAVDVDFVLRAA